MSAPETTSTLVGCAPMVMGEVVGSTMAAAWSSTKFAGRVSEETALAARVEAL